MTESPNPQAPLTADRFEPPKHDTVGSAPTDLADFAEARPGAPADGAAQELSGAGLNGALAVAETQAWLDRVVIGLRLCPFAKAARSQGRTRIVASSAADANELVGDFVEEARRLLLTPASKIETTLLVHPAALTDFDTYNDFLDIADAALEALGATDVLQVASFHPAYRFADTLADDITNATNRSPYPMLQLLREDSVSAALETLTDPESIYTTNMDTLRTLGPERWAALQVACRRDAVAAMASSDPGP